MTGLGAKEKGKRKIRDSEHGHQVLLEVKVGPQTFSLFRIKKKKNVW